jgi:acyl-CoA-binding protein
MEELMKELAATPRTLAHLVVEANDELLDKAPEGEWSARTVLAHLRDDEYMVMRMRLARMLSENGPVFADFDEQAWSVKRNRARDRKEELLGDFALQRQATLNVLANLRPGDEQRPGRHEAYGDYTIRSWVEHWVDHDRTHIAQIERMLGETLGDVLERRAHEAE